MAHRPTLSPVPEADRPTLLLVPEAEEAVLGSKLLHRLTAASLVRVTFAAFSDAPAAPASARVVVWTQ